jgi:hypothetical protein
VFPGGAGRSKIKFDKPYSKSELKGNIDEAPSCFKPDLKRHTCTSDSYLSIRILLLVAFNSFPLTLIILEDTKMNGNIHPKTGHAAHRGIKY